MSEAIKHECGFALLRLRKPLEYYATHYGTWMYGLNKLYLLMEKQHNRGQDGAGFATIKINPKPGKPYIDRLRSNSQNRCSIFLTNYTKNSIKLNKSTAIEYMILIGPKKMSLLPENSF